LVVDADVVVIGSGSGGLAAAVALAQAGKRVIVLEQHEIPGGWCHSFSRGGYHFSPGVHYIGQLQAGGTTAEIYEGLGVADDLEFFELDSNAIEQCTISGTSFKYCRNADLLRDRFQKQFPDDSAGLERYFKLVNNVYEQIPLAGNLKTILDFVTVPYHTRHLGRYGLQSLKRVLESEIKNPLLRAFLAVQSGDHGLPPARAPFALHCGVSGHYFNGGYYPLGGGMAIPLALRKALKKSGGELRLNSRVQKIILEKRKSKFVAMGVKLDDGTEIRATQIISNADPHQTFRNMVGDEHLSAGLRKKLAKTRYSLPAISLFFAIDKDPRAFGMTSGNVWYMRDADLDAGYERVLRPEIFEGEQFDGLFVTAMSLKDPTQFNGKHHTLEAVTFVGFEAFRKFQTSGPEKRSLEYETLKAKIYKMMIKTLDSAVPGISKHIVFSELGTPNTSQHFINATDGACYGTEKSRTQLGPFGFGVRTEVTNLFLCGASTSAHGVSGAANSGLQSAAAALGARREDLLKPGLQKMRTYLAEEASTWPQAVKDKIARHQKL
jgi:all-trans-retinol 13,14-reductase